MNRKTIIFCDFKYIILYRNHITYLSIGSQMQQLDNTKFSYLDEFKIIKTLGSGYHAQ